MGRAHKRPRIGRGGGEKVARGRGSMSLNAFRAVASGFLSLAGGHGSGAGRTTSASGARLRALQGLTRV